MGLGIFFWSNRFCYNEAKGEKNVATMKQQNRI
jgi:hypothetical protein